MRVLIGCESSGRVRDAFRARGHDAWSCDLLPSENKSRFHVQADLLGLLQDEWDLAIFHPPCTHLAGSGARWLTDHWVTKKAHPEGRYWHDGSEKRAAQQDALQFVLDLWAAPIPRIALENPVGMLSTLWRKPTQIIEPWQFWHLSLYGTGEKKATCLWLKNLPPLVPTTPDEPGRTQACWRMPPGPDRWKERSRTYIGIASAMAEQWGSL